MSFYSQCGIYPVGKKMRKSHLMRQRSHLKSKSKLEREQKGRRMKKSNLQGLKFLKIPEHILVTSQLTH